VRVLVAFLVILVGAVSALAENDKPFRWKIQYFYDKDEGAFAISDLRFSSPERGIAVGQIVDRNGNGKPMSVITRDGGANWTQVPLPDAPVSVFLLNDNVGWMVTGKGLWQTDEAGRSWKKVKGMRGLKRVHFDSETHGWATGAPKLFMETADGGKSWKPVAGIKEINTAEDATYFDWMEWATPKTAIVLGAHVARRRVLTGSWMDPSTLAATREWPGVSITLETKDAGKTWKAATVPLFGRYHRFRSSTVYSASVALIRFVNTFRYPSEVYLVDTKGKSSSVFKQANRKVTDLAWVGKSVMLAAVAPPGKLHQLPVPGPVHVLTTIDFKTWTEMPVDYRAFGNELVMTTFGADAWIASDSGQILKLSQ